MRAKDIMTTPVVSVAPETGVSEVARLLLELNISAVPVIQGGGGPRAMATGTAPGGCDSSRYPDIGRRSM